MPELLTDPLRMGALYVAINALIMLVLSMLVVRARVKTSTLIGDDAKPAMVAAARAHGNNTEYTPIILLTMFVVESLGGSGLAIHAIGLPLTLGRLSHAYGLSTTTGLSIARFAGMVLTWIALIAGIVLCVWFAVEPRPIS